MLIAAFVQWWYGPGWRDAAARLQEHIRKTYLNFSMPILLRTLFAPWRRITTPPGSSLQQKFQALIDNLISRCIGFTVRLMALFAGVCLIIFFVIFGGLVVLLWPVLPFLGPALIVLGLVL
jgi:hypothetical protein